MLKRNPIPYFKKYKKFIYYNHIFILLTATSLILNVRNPRIRFLLILPFWFLVNMFTSLRHEMPESLSTWTFNGIFFLLFKEVHSIWSTENLHPFVKSWRMFWFHNQWWIFVLNKINKTNNCLVYFKGISSSRNNRLYVR